LTVWQAIIMGLVQGLGEFLPISSSAHLILVPWIFHWPDPGLTFDVALHFGTLVAVLLYFWKDWWRLIQGAFNGSHSADGRLFWYLVIATVPGAIFGILLEKKAETAFRSPLLIALLLIIMGIILYWADTTGSKQTGMKGVRIGHGLLIGLSQALAILPGVSRSGITMTTGLLTGLNRETAARFSFLLSAPIILGASLVKLPSLLKHPSMVNLPFVVGVVVSAIAGVVSIGFLLRYIQRNDFKLFVWYRFLLGALVIVLFLIRR
jgi:undecaprenyl-diphosphatase